MINLNATHKPTEPIPLATFPDIREAKNGNHRLLATRANFRHLCRAYGVSLWRVHKFQFAQMQIHGQEPVQSVVEMVAVIDDLAARCELPTGKIAMWVRAELDATRIPYEREEAMGLGWGWSDTLPVNTRIDLGDSPL